MELAVDDLVLRRFDDQTVALVLSTGRYFSVNPAGATVLERLGTGSASVEELVEAVTDAFDVDPAVARRDVDPFLDDLRGNGLVRG